MFEPESQPPVCLHMLDQKLTDQLWSYGCRLRYALDQLTNAIEKLKATSPRTWELIGADDVDVHNYVSRELLTEIANAKP